MSTVLVIEGQRTFDLSHNLFSIDKQANGLNYRTLSIRRQVFFFVEAGAAIVDML